MSASLVGSEMCIRDSLNPAASFETRQQVARDTEERVPLPAWRQSLQAVSYTHLTLPTICSV
eukprot:378741-Alexandrium_andersonii.AAC.1